MIRNWLKIFVFHLKQNKLFSTLNVLGLSIGIAGLIFAMLYWNDEHEFNRWNPEKNRVYQIVNKVDGDYWPTNVAPLGPILKREVSEVEDFFYFRNWYKSDNVTTNGKNFFTKKIFIADSSFFRFFPFRIVKGDERTAFKSKTDAMVSAETAKALFGDANPIGQRITVQQQDFVVKGVYEVQKPSSVEPNVIIPLELEQDKDSWGNFNYGLMVRLKDGADPADVEKKIEHINFEFAVKPRAKDAGMTVEDWLKKFSSPVPVLESLATTRLHSHARSALPEGQGNYRLLAIMVGLSILILVLSLVNYINLATASAVKRAKEVGVRKIIGATKKNIVLQFIFETALITLFAILLALAIAELSLPYYNEFLEKSMSLNGMQFFGQLAAIFIIVIIFAGVFPAFYVANFETLKVLKGNFSRSKSGIWVRNTMLVTQFAIAALFIIGAFVVYEQVRFISTMDLGYNRDQVVTLELSEAPNWEDTTSGTRRLQRYERIKAELLKIGGVVDVTANNAMPTRTESSSNLDYLDTSVQAQNFPVDYNYPQLMGMKLVQGRFLTPKFASDSINTCLLNETAVRELGLKNPIGTKVNPGFSDKDFEVVGVIKDFNIHGAQIKIAPVIFVHFKSVGWMKNGLNKVTVKLQPEAAESAIASIEKYWTTTVEPNYPFSYEFLDKAFERTYKTYAKQKTLFFILNLVVIVIAIFGLFALASFSMERRFREIAIRKTLGAETGLLMRNLSRQYIIFCIIGFAVAVLPTYLLLQQWLEHFAYRIDIPLLPFVIAFVGLVILTLAIVLAKAWQVTRIDILKYLKYE